MRKFKLECRIFSGFPCIIDEKKHNTISSIINEVLNTLKAILKQNNFQILLKKMETMKYHTHYDIEYVKNEDNKNKTFIICGNCEIVHLVI